MRTFIISFWMLVCVVMVGAISPYADIAMVLRPAISLLPVYDAMPSRGADYVLYEGEPLSLTVELFNTTETPQTLMTGGVEPGQDLRVRVIRDGQAEDIQATFLPEVHQTGPRVDLPSLWPTRISVLPHRTFEINATLDRQVPAGLYEFQLETTLKDEGGRAVRPQGGTLRIEVRELSPDNEIEVQLRRGEFAFMRGDYAEAERQIARLQARWPNSFGIYALRGNIAMSQGRPADATALYDRALQILQSGADVEFAKKADAVRYQRMLRGISGSRAKAAGR
jgi:hypothetical protein